LEGGFVAIASLSGLKPPKGWDDANDPATGKRAELARLLADRADTQLFDLVIFDEAHLLRNSETQAHKLGSLMMDVADYKLLLSATPINLHANDLRTLLKLLDPDTFEREWLFDILQMENKPLLEACAAARDTRIPLDQLKTLVAAIPEGEVLKTGQRLERLRAELDAGVEDTPASRVAIASRLEEMSLLGSIMNRTRRRDVAEFKVERRPKTVRWTMAPTEREFYAAATDCIAEYAFANDINERFLLAQTQRLLASSIPAAYRNWGQRSGALTVDDAEDDTPIPGRLVAALGDVCGDHAELASLEEGDTKVANLITTIREIATREPDQKLIVFSSFRLTIDYLAKRLLHAGIPIVVLHGGIKEERQSILERFADSAAGAVLLTSEVGGEGLDLQFCRILINFDLPWNPMKVEQRIGRIDRIGQSAPAIDIINLIAGDTIEERVYERLYVRLGIIKDTIGDFEPILGEIVRQIEEALTNPALSPEAQALEIDRAAQAAANMKQQTENLEREAAGLIAHGDSILQRVRDAQAPHRTVTPGDLKDYVAATLVGNFDGTRFEAAADSAIDAFDVRLSSRAQAEFDRFRTNKARRYLTRFSRDASTGVRVVFGRNPEPMKFRRVESVLMSHPLARFAAEVRSNKLGGTPPRPACAIKLVANAEIPLSVGRYVFLIERWSLEAIVPIDRLVFGGARINDGVIILPDAAEQAVMTALAGMSTMNTLAGTDLTTAVNALEAVVLPELEQRRIAFEETEAARHYDLVDTQRSLLIEHRRRRTLEMEDRIRKYRFDHPGPKADQLARMEKGKLEKFKARIDLKIVEMKQREAAFSLVPPVRAAALIIDIEASA
jgi:hypothetical protein